MEQQPDASRRVVIKGVAALGLAGAAGLPLAACGGRAGEAAAPPAPPTSPAVAPPPGASAGATAGAAAGSTKTGTPQGRARGGKATRTPEPAPATADAAKAKKKPKATATQAAPLVPKGQPIADAAEIPVGSGTLFEIDELIVTQPTSGDFRGFTSLCPHEGCVIDVFEGDQMICACHNSYFRIANGEKVRGPASGPVPRRPIVVVDGKVYRA